MKLNIRNKLLLPIIGIVGGIMMCSTLITSSIVSDELLNIYTNKLMLIGDSVSMNVRNIALGYKRDITTLAALPGVKTLALAIEGNSEAEIKVAAREALHELNTFTSVYTHLPVINIATSDGLVLTGTNKEAIGKVNVNKRKYFQLAMQGKISFSEPLMSMDTKDKAIVVGAPILDSHSKPIAVMYAVLPCKDIVKSSIEGIKIGNTGYVYLVDSSGLMLAHQDHKLILDFDFKKIEWGQKVFRGGDSGHMSYTTVTGLSRILAYKLDKNSGWYSIVTIDQSEIDDTIISLRNLSILIMVIGIILVIFVVFMIVRPIITDLLQGVVFATAVAEGDLNKEFTAKRNDELGTLFNTLRHMVTNLKSNINAAHQESERAQIETVKCQEAMQVAEQAGNEAKKKTDAMLIAANRLEEVAQVVSSASEELSVQIAQSEHGSAQQAARVTETATAMEEMNSTALEVAKNASQAAEVSLSTRQKAENGSKVVQLAVDSIMQVQQQSTTLKNDMVILSQNAQSINQIMSVIFDIADQTNLLALNAAIEAARAGDAGRGFAVVADEVRKLAEKTMASTTDVGNAIKAIQQSADKSMIQMDAAVKTIEKATEYANQSGKALAEIVNMVDHTADQVRAIATASEQQSATSEEINQSIAHVNGIASETARAMQEASRAVSDLAKQAQVLTTLIEDMKH